MFTNEDIEQAMREVEALTSGPRPYNTYNPIVLICAICQQEMSLSHHRCPTMISCVYCGDVHSMQFRGCQ